MTRVMYLQLKYGIAKSLADVLLLLVDNPAATLEMIENSTGLKAVRPAVSRLRAKLGNHGIGINNRQGVGYWLSEDDRATIRTMLDKLRGEVQ